MDVGSLPVCFLLTAGVGRQIVQRYFRTFNSLSRGIRNSSQNGG